MIDDSMLSRLLVLEACTCSCTARSAEDSDVLYERLIFLWFSEFKIFNYLINYHYYYCLMFYLVY
jgi:hypothetical protein